MHAAVTCTIYQVLALNQRRRWGWDLIGEATLNSSVFRLRLKHAINTGASSEVMSQIVPDTWGIYSESSVTYDSLHTGITLPSNGRYQGHVTRDAMLARYMLSSCLSVRPSVTRLSRIIFNIHI